MAFDVVGPLGKSGQVIISDSRDDGTVLLFVCEAYRPDVGAIFAKPDRESPSEKPGFPWPSRQADANLHGSVTSVPEHIRKPFELTINTSDMPSGPQVFSVDAFLQRLFRVVDEGAGKISLDSSNAAEWGWQPEAQRDFEASLAS